MTRLEWISDDDTSKPRRSGGGVAVLVEAPHSATVLKHHVTTPSAA